MGLGSNVVLEAVAWPTTCRNRRDAPNHRVNFAASLRTLHRNSTGWGTTLLCEQFSRAGWDVGVSFNGLRGGGISRMQ